MFLFPLQIYFDVSQGDVDLGRIEIGLFGQIVPKTVKNFVEVSCRVGKKKKFKKKKGKTRDSPWFLVANKQLYIRVCPSVGPSVVPSRVFFKPRN